MTGKLADTVMAVRNGEQIARKYQPVVFNPSTPAQIAQRAKLKLLSQVSAVFAPVIAMPRQGAVSARNLFTKENFGSTTYSDNKADIDLLSLRITKSVVGLPNVVATAEVQGLSVGLQSSVGDAFDRVVYVYIVRQGDDTIRYRASLVVEKSSDNPEFTGTMTGVTDSRGVVYAYGIRDNSENARVVFGNMSVPTAQTIAQLLVSRTLLESDVTLSETKTVAVNPASTNLAPVPDENRSSRKK